MRRLFVALTITSLIIGGAQACASKAPPVDTPKALALWQANEAVVYINSLQHVAIGLNAVQVCPTPPATEPACHPLISDKNTGIVVDASSAARKTIQAFPEGWKATANAALDGVSKQLDDMGKTKLLPYIEVARTLINAIIK